MIRYLPQRGPMLGEAACHFDLAYQHLLKAILCLDAAELEVSEEVGAIVEDVAGLACGATALADEYAGEVAAQRIEIANRNDGGAIAPPWLSADEVAVQLAEITRKTSGAAFAAPPARSPDPAGSPEPTISHRRRA